ncbi:MAG TPA: Panacea domain-containing protein [Burkholderiaceae bacterium]
METMNWEKFKALVHYICEKASDPSVLGAVKLNKVLWYSDSIRYMVTGHSITGESYVKRQHGPVPRHIVSAVDQLVAEGLIARGRVDHFGFVKTEYIAIAECDTSIFSVDEIKLVDSAFEHVCLNHTAKTVSEETHGIIWRIANMGEEIPLATVFASDVGEVDETDFAWAKEKLAA